MHKDKVSRTYYMKKTVVYEKNSIKTSRLLPEWFWLWMPKLSKCQCHVQFNAVLKSLSILGRSSACPATIPVFGIAKPLFDGTLDLFVGSVLESSSYCFWNKNPTKYSDYVYLNNLSLDGLGFRYRSNTIFKKMHSFFKWCLFVCLASF